MKIQITETISKPPIADDVKKIEPPPTPEQTIFLQKADDVIKLEQPLQRPIGVKSPTIIWTVKHEEKDQKFIDPFGERNSLYYRRLEDYEYLKESDMWTSGWSIRFNPYLE
ncbi:hypothetical protein BLA29_013701, partial [Euroglyphus maynei]